MTREEQIKQAAKDYAADNPDQVQALIEQVGFEMGAGWADSNPSEDTIMQIVEAYKLWVQEFYSMPLTEFVVKWLKRND